MKKNISFVLMALWITLALAACGKTKPEGIYLFRGGLHYIQIARERGGKLTTISSYFGYGKYNFLASMENGLLIIKTPQDYGWMISYELLPSKEIPGDWDLIRVFQYFPSLISGEKEFDPKTIPPLRQPYPSFLHRVDDPRIIEYFKITYEEDNLTLASHIPDPDMSSRLMDLASKLVSSHPDDLDLRTLYLDALIRSGDDLELEKQAKALKETYEKKGNSYHKHIFQEVENHLTARRLSFDGKNGRDIMLGILSRDNDFPTRLRRLPELLDYEKYAEQRTGLIVGVVTNYLEIQASSKSFCVWAAFLQLRGQRKEALQILAANYHLVHLMDQGGNLISRLIGFSLRAIAARGLELYALNSCETLADFDEFWNTLERLNYPWKDLTLEEIDRLEDGPLYPEELEWMRSHLTEHLTRQRVSYAKFELVRMATAAKRHFISQGSFPTVPQDFAPLLAEGPPRDPFSKDPLRFIPGSDPFACYSIGPDDKDDRAEFSYDPTNGTKSPGDIYVKIPREREYPFPRGGVHAKNPADLLRQFPNGLPPDPFADTKGKPFGIANTDPILVYSYGPDTNESEAQQEGDQYVPQIPYDPTNGTVTIGDIFIQIPN